MTCKRRKTALFFFHADQRVSIRRFCLEADEPHGLFIAAQLQIPVRQDVHNPHQGIKPVDAQDRRQKKFLDRVQPADMHKLVGQNESRLRVPSKLHLIRHQNHRLADSIRQRRSDPVGTAQTDAPSQALFLNPLLPYGIFHRQRSAKFFSAAKVHRHKKQRTDRSAQNPNAKSPGAPAPFQNTPQCARIPPFAAGLSFPRCSA